MGAFANFEKIINSPVWKQRATSTRNYLCTKPNCYSTCGVEHSVGRVLLLVPMQLVSCSTCHHSHWFHFHLRSEWVQEQETQVSVDDNMRIQWEAAKGGKEKTEALVATSKGALDDLSRAMDKAMKDLARLAEEYASLSLSGCFSAPLEKAIRLLEQRCKGMEEKGVSLDQLEKMERSLEQMKGRLDLLRKAKDMEVVTKAKDVWGSVLRATEPVQNGARRVFGKVKEGKVDTEVEQAGVKVAEVKETEFEMIEVQEVQELGWTPTSPLVPGAWLSGRR
jgi:hypothetical protein